jgi:hypothetical protein
VDRSLPCRVEEQRSRGHRVAIHAGRGLLHRAAPYALARAAGDRPRVVGRADDQGDWDFRYEVLHVTDDTAYVRGWTIYEDGVVGNLWVVRFAREQRCRSFTEWWMVEDA